METSGGKRVSGRMERDGMICKGRSAVAASGASGGSLSGQMKGERRCPVPGAAPVAGQRKGGSR